MIGDIFNRSSGLLAQQQYQNAYMQQLAGMQNIAPSFQYPVFQYPEPELKNVKAPPKTIRQELQADVDLWLKGI